LAEGSPKPLELYRPELFATPQTEWYTVVCGIAGTEKQLQSAFCKDTVFVFLDIFSCAVNVEGINSGNARQKSLQNSGNRQQSSYQILTVR
jgi:hypothetical protein